MGNYKSSKNHKSLEPKGEATKNYWDSLSKQQQKKALDRRKEKPKYPQDYKPSLMDDIAPTEVPVTAQGKVLRALGWKGATEVEQRRYKAKTGKVRK